MIHFKQILAKLEALKAPSEYLADRLADQNPLENRICTVCAHVGPPIHQMAGRADVELALWRILLGLAIVYAIDSIILEFTSFVLFRWFFKLTSLTGKILALLSIAYTLIRISHQKNTCPTCGGTEVIPLNSPRARQLLENQRNSQ